MKEHNEKLLALELDIFKPEKSFQAVQDYYKTCDRKELINLAQNTDCDILGLRFNIEEKEEIKTAAEMLRELLPLVEKPLMIRGTNNDELDKLLLPELMKELKKESIVASANENTYKTIVPEVIKGGHTVVLRSPIDINLCKELNILSIDLGLSLDKIFIDTDIGGLGYGLEYGYSIMEKIKLEGMNGDNYLNMPVISFVCEESLKTKEAKESNEASIMIEIASASAVFASGANIVVINHPETLQTMRELV